jgi:hypothetical protein
MTEPSFKFYAVNSAAGHYYSANFMQEMKGSKTLSIFDFADQAGINPQKVIEHHECQKAIEDIDALGSNYGMIVFPNRKGKSHVASRPAILIYREEF